METRVVLGLVLVLQIAVSMVSATRNAFASNDSVAVNQPATSKNPHNSRFDFNMSSNKGFKTIEGVRVDNAAYSRGLRKIGSSPPSCEHKCYGCTPCEAIQVPTTRKIRSHLNVNYANYEPEGWKCKCGPSFYSP